MRTSRIQKHPPNTVYLEFENFFSRANRYNHEDSPMTSFKVINKTYEFTTQGEIDFIDLSDKVQEEVSSSGIKNGVVHVFAPHATGILILTENDHALLKTSKNFLKNWRQNMADISTRQMRIHICGRCFFRQTRPCQ